LQPSLILTVKARAKSTTQHAILHARNTRVCNAAQAPRARKMCSAYHKSPANPLWVPPFKGW